MCGSDIFLAILAIFFPPVAVWIKVGLCTADSIINLALCCLAYIPGLLHAWYIILKYPEPDYDDPGYVPIPEATPRTVTSHITMSPINPSSTPPNGVMVPCLRNNPTRRTLSPSSNIPHLPNSTNMLLEAAAAAVAAAAGITPMRGHLPHTPKQ